MLKIKLARFGKRHQPHFRIVVNEARDKRDGKYVENLGYYAPTLQPKTLKIDLNLYDQWVKKGAQPTETVAFLVDTFRSGKPFVAKKKISKKAAAKLQKPAEEAPAAPVEAPVETAEVAKTAEPAAVEAEAPAKAE